MSVLSKFLRILKSLYTNTVSLEFEIKSELKQGKPAESLGILPDRLTRISDLEMISENIA